MVIPIACVMLGSQVVLRGGALGTGFLTLVLNLAIWSFAKWAVGWYADVQHLSLRDFTEMGFPIDRLVIPAAVFVFSIIVEVLLRWRGATAWLLGLHAGVGATAITWWITGGLSSDAGFGAGEQFGSVVLSCVVAGVIAALIGAATWRLGKAMRAANTARTAISDMAAAA